MPSVVQKSPQVHRTKQWLYEALFSLMEEKPYASITVGQICKRADLSRAVFYNHFKDKDALLYGMFMAIMEGFTEQMLKRSEQEPLTPQALYTAFFETLWKNRAFLIQLRNNHYTPMLTYFITHEYEKIYKFIQLPVAVDSEEYRRYFIKYHAAACRKIVVEWLKDPNPPPPEKMAELVLKLNQNVDKNVCIRWEAGNVVDALRRGEDEGPSA